MKKFELSDEMLTDIDEIDNQHRLLLSWGNALSSDDTEANVMKVEEALGNLTRYVAYHFRAEEDAMKRYGYERLEKHQKQHERLMIEVAKLVNRSKKEGIGKGLLTELQYQFTDWFIHHIKRWDQPFASFLKSSNISPIFPDSEEEIVYDWTDLN